MHSAYVPDHSAQSLFITVRGLRCHVNTWGDESLVRPDRPPLFLMHGWMDVGASYQFVVDEMARVEGFRRYAMAPDWRGFGRSEAPATDSYWFPDYLGDLDSLLDQLAPAGAIDLVGHSMGGNVVMTYAGMRPERIRRLVNLEGFGLPDMPPQMAPRRLLQWLDELKLPQVLRSYDSLQAVAERLMANNPLLSADKAAWLAPHWSERRDDGRWHILGDPAHKRTNPVLYRKEEILAGWRLISAPVLWVEGDRTDMTKWWGDRYPRSDFDSRLSVVGSLQKELLSPSGHMVHHDQPRALATLMARFLA
jgi:pimeloyl-ACP methyl ester carboxylesterase